MKARAVVLLSRGFFFENSAEVCAPWSPAGAGLNFRLQNLLRYKGILFARGFRPIRTAEEDREIKRERMG